MSESKLPTPQPRIASQPLLHLPGGVGEKASLGQIAAAKPLGGPLEGLLKQVAPLRSCVRLLAEAPRSAPAVEELVAVLISAALPAGSRADCTKKLQK